MKDNTILLVKQLIFLLLVVRGATARINTVGTGSVDDILIDDVGSNFAVNDVINFDNTGTDGQGISAVVQVVGGAVAPEVSGW